jgi:hypothetical protein
MGSHLHQRREEKQDRHPAISRYKAEPEPIGAGRFGKLVFASLAAAVAVIPARAQAPTDQATQLEYVTYALSVAAADENEKFMKWGGIGVAGTFLLVGIASFFTRNRKDP